MTWAGLAERPILETAATVFAFLAASRISRFCGNHPVLNPTLIAIILISLGLETTHIPYETYLRGADVIQFMLAPAVVLLAVPLFRQRAIIRASARLIAVGLAVGLPVGVLSAVGIAWMFGADSQTILSLAPKSVTAGIAVGISEQIGGLQTLTVVLVIMTGITGAILGPIIARIARIDDPRVVGLTMGIASHGIGTARALQINEVAGAFSGLGMGLNGVLTAILLPLICRLL
ncbi:MULTISPECIES: LrgB family protein [unclassified Bradyrhizobium]